MALTVAGYALLSRLNALDFENQAQNKLIDQLSSDLEDLDREVYDHPRHVEKNEDGTYSVTRLKKRLKTEDPS